MSFIKPYEPSSRRFVWFAFPKTAETTGRWGVTTVYSNSYTVLAHYFYAVGYNK